MTAAAGRRHRPSRFLSASVQGRPTPAADPSHHPRGGRGGGRAGAHGRRQRPSPSQRPSPPRQPPVAAVPPSRQSPSLPCCRRPPAPPPPTCRRDGARGLGGKRERGVEGGEAGVCATSPSPHTEPKWGGRPAAAAANTVAAATVVTAAADAGRPIWPPHTQGEAPTNGKPWSHASRSPPVPPGRPLGRSDRSPA